jgi:hypothetical protein
MSEAIIFDSFDGENSVDHLNRATLGSEPAMDGKDPLAPVYRELSEIKTDVREIRRSIETNFRWLVSIIVGSSIGICGVIMHFVK